MARPCWVAAGWVSPRRAVRVVTAAAALTGWDLFLDPRMVAEGYWTWARPGRYAGVPLSNFVGWFTTGLVLFAAVAVLDPTPVDGRDDLALAWYVWTWTGETFANAVLWRRRLPAAAGALGMGAVAIPALRRRLRR